jgi:hypothetical protein
MLDVHPPHSRIQGFKDFSLRLLTITIGLLIALSLEGCVEWQHRRHLVHEAEAGLNSEIRQNVQALVELRQHIKDEQTELDADLKVLAGIRAHPDRPHNNLSFSFRIRGFDDVAWKTAQTTGAFGFMSYDEDRTYSDIYDTQGEVLNMQRLVIEDVFRSASLVINQPDDAKITASEIDSIGDAVGMVQLRLMLLNSYADALDRTYKKYEASHS